LIPKDNNLWVFGAWNGQNYSDNPKWLLECLRKTDLTIRPIWLTRNRLVLRFLKSRNIEAYYAYSLRGYLYSARAKVGIVSAGIFDINRFVVPPILVNTWHGTPMKKVGKEFLSYRRERDNSLLGRVEMIVRTVFAGFDPFYKLVPNEQYKLFTANSETEARLLRESFGPIRVEVTGQPRLDVFFGRLNEFGESLGHKKLILYLPTHRFEGKKRMVPKILDGLVDIDDILERVGAEMYIKLHAFHQYENRDLKNGLHCARNIHVIADEQILGDIYPILAQADILITDYSSVYIDYLVTRRPVIFFPFDIDEYMKYERQFNFEYDEITPGPKCSTWDCVAHWIERMLANPEYYKDERERVMSIFHTYHDGNNCKRVVNAIRRILSE